MTALFRPSFTHNALAVAIAVACFSPAVLAQGIDVPLRVAVTALETQGIRGQLSDDRNVLLQGAQVRIIGSNRETTTDRQGRFRFDNLAVGTYQLEIRYLGYAAKSVDVAIGAEQGACGGAHG